jgi:hypothetical protein
MARNPSSKPAQSPDDPYTVERVRQGQIVFSKPWEVVVFFAGLIVSILMGLAVLFFVSR